MTIPTLDAVDLVKWGMLLLFIVLKNPVMGLLWIFSAQFVIDPANINAHAMLFGFGYIISQWLGIKKG